MLKIFFIMGSLNAFLAVLLGAFGAHGLKEKLSSDMLSVYQTGVQYHLIHALGLILIAIAADKFAGDVLVTWSGWLLFVGIIFFSGSLYVLSTTGIKALGAVAPIGGTAFLAGWILLLVASIRSL